MADKFEQWCLVELFGHSRIAGFVTEQTIGGQSFVRVDVPDTTAGKAFTRLFGSGAIYAMNPCAESVARNLAERLQVAPITPWDLPDDIKEKIRAGEKLLIAKKVPDDDDVIDPEFEIDDDGF